jgi:hypothetical protein
MTETGFREMGWDTALLEEQYRDHVTLPAPHRPLRGHPAMTGPAAAGPP